MKNIFKKQTLWLTAFVISVLCIAWTIPANSAENLRLIPFQGRLTDAEGAALNGVYRITFAIYDAPTGGVASWTEFHESVSVINGQLNVLLGSITKLDDPDDNGDTSDAVLFDASSGPRFLGIKVGEDTNQEMIPRQQLVPAFHARTADHATEADHALEADNADTLDGHDSSYFLSPSIQERVNISASSDHLRLDRASSETTGGNTLFLELLQHDSLSHDVPLVYPSIRFHHVHRHWHRIEGREDGLHFKDGDFNSDVHCDIHARNIIADGLDVNGVAFLGYENTVLDFGSALKSGFYQDGAQFIPGDVPDQSSEWTHLITARHGNPDNNYQLQIGANYTNNDRLFFRKIAHATAESHNPPWHEVATRGSNTFLGTQHFLNSVQVTGTYGFANQNTDWGKITFQSTGDGPGESYMVFQTFDNGHEPFYFQMRNGSSTPFNPVKIDESGIHVNGRGFATQGFFPCSDKRLKRNIEPLDDSLNKVLELRGVSYEWRSDEFPEMGFTEGTQIGLIAQEVETIIPELVSTKDNGYKALSYEKLGAVLVEAIKEQQTIIAELKTEIEGLRTRVEALED